MAFSFSAAELSLVQNAFTQADSGQVPHWLIYQTISDIIRNPDGTLRNEVDPAVSSWLIGAQGVNAGFTLYSDFIRSYSAIQYQLRFQEASGVSLQDISNNVANAVALDILTSGKLPDLYTLGQQDANATISGYFEGQSGGWSGNPLFIFLGEDEFFRQNILNPDDTGYELCAFMQSSMGALGSFVYGGVGGVLLDLAGLAFGSLGVALTNGALDLVFDSISLTDAFVLDTYGVSSYDLFGAYEITIGHSTNNDEFFGTSAADAVFGGGGNDILAGGTDTDIIDGGAGADILSGDQQGDILIGGAGDDTLVGGSIGEWGLPSSIDLTQDFSIWNDGAGDTLRGGDGNDRYLICITEGETWDWAYGQDANEDGYASLMNIIDTIDEGDGDGIGSILLQMKHESWPEGEQFEQIQIAGSYEVNQFAAPGSYRAGSQSLMLKYIADESGAVIPYLFVMAGYPSHPVLAIKDFYQGDFGIELESYVRVRPSGSQRASAETASEPTVIEPGTRNVDTRDLSASSEGVTVDLSSGAGSGGDADGQTFISIENLVGSSHSDALSGNSSANYLRGEGGDDTLEGHGGHDTLVGHDGNDTISGGTGNDILAGGAGGDTYLYSQGDGIDRIYDVAPDSAAAGDTLVFTDLNLSDMSLARRGDDLVVALLASGETITVYGQFKGSEDGLELIRFADQTFIDRDELDAIGTLAGSPLDDVINSGSGDDLILSSTGDDVVIYQRGDGNDVLASGQGGGDDVLRLEDISLSEVRFRKSGDDLILAIAGQESSMGNGGSITIKNAFSTSVVTSVRLVEFSGSVSRTIEQITALFQPNADEPEVISGTPGDDILVGGAGAQVIVGGDGDDEIHADGDDVWFEGGNGDDTLVYTGTDDREYALAQGDFENMHAGVGNNSVWGTDGDNRISGGAGDDTLFGYGGDDVLIGDGGADSLMGGDGDDVVYADGDDVWFSGDSGNDTLVYTGADDREISLVQGSFENIRAGQGNNTVWGDDEANIIEGEGGDDTLFGFAGDDILIGGAGADSIMGGDGNDEIHADADDSWFAGDNGVDTLIYTSSNAFDYALAQGDFENIKAGAGDNTIWGTSASNIIDGQAGSDTLFGYDGDDTLIGGAGADELSGGLGNDVFVFKDNFGQDTIVDFQAGASSEDVIEFQNTLFSDFTEVLAASTQVGSDTLITYDVDNVITLSNVALTSLHQDDFRFVA